MQHACMYVSRLRGEHDLPCLNFVVFDKTTRQGASFTSLEKEKTEKARRRTGKYLSQAPKNAGSQGDGCPDIYSTTCVLCCSELSQHSSGGGLSTQQRFIRQHCLKATTTVCLRREGADACKLRGYCCANFMSATFYSVSTLFYATPTTAISLQLGAAIAVGASSVYGTPANKACFGGQRADGAAAAVHTSLLRASHALPKI